MLRMRNKAVETKLELANSSTEYVNRRGRLTWRFTREKPLAWTTERQSLDNLIS